MLILYSLIGIWHRRMRIRFSSAHSCWLLMNSCYNCKRYHTSAIGCHMVMTCHTNIFFISLKSDDISSQFLKHSSSKGHFLRVHWMHWTYIFFFSWHSTTMRKRKEFKFNDYIHGISKQNEWKFVWTLNRYEDIYFIWQGMHNVHGAHGTAPDIYYKLPYIFERNEKYSVSFFLCETFVSWHPALWMLFCLFSPLCHWADLPIEIRLQWSGEFLSLETWNVRCKYWAMN